MTNLSLTNHSKVKPQEGLLQYRAWQGIYRGDDRAAMALFLAAQAGLFSIMVASVSRPYLCLAAMLTFLGLWGLVTRCRAWPIARVSLTMIFRRKLFWAIYGLAMLIFLMFFFGQYLMSWAATQLGEQDIKVGALGRANPKFIVDILRNQLKLNGSAETFRNFIRFEGYTAMIILALAGSILIGNDLRYYSLPFYLSKPISRWDYILGKGLAVAVFINLMTTLPALALFIEFGLLEDWQYLLDNIRLPVGILAYGLILTVSLTSILLATATLLRRSVPLIMTWTALFFFCRLLSRSLVDLLQMDPRFRLIDLWNTTVLLGSTCLGVPVDNSVPYAQPSWQEAALVLGGVTVLCLSYLILRIRGAEIVR